MLNATLHFHMWYDIRNKKTKEHSGEVLSQNDKQGVLSVTVSHHHRLFSGDTESPVTGLVVPLMKRYVVSELFYCDVPCVPE